MAVEDLRWAIDGWICCAQVMMNPAMEVRCFVMIGIDRKMERWRRMIMVFGPDSLDNCGIISSQL